MYKTYLNLILLALFSSSCTTPKKVVNSFLTEKDFQKHRGYLSADCQNYMKSRGDTLPQNFLTYSENTRSIKVLSQEKRDKRFYFVSAHIILKDGREFDLVEVNDIVDLRFRVMKENKQWKVILVNCINNSNEFIKPSE